MSIRGILALLLLLPVMLLACAITEVVPSETLQTTTPSGSTTEPISEQQLELEAMIPRISVEELKAKYDRHEDMLIADARPLADYNAEHIMGAVSAPVRDIATGDWIPPEDKDREIIFYCT